MTATTCIGFALGFAFLTCTTPGAAPSGKATLCRVIEQAGGKQALSRRDTRGTKEYLDKIHAAYDRDCRRGRP